MTRPGPREIEARYDVVVLGAGAAGIAAAVSAARAGRRALLVEKHGFLGGTMTATTLGGISGLYSQINGRPHQMGFGLAEEVRAMPAEPPRASRRPVGVGYAARCCMTIWA